jgi:hypothetical protein
MTSGSESVLNQDWSSIQDHPDNANQLGFQLESDWGVKQITDCSHLEGGLNYHHLLQEWDSPNRSWSQTVHPLSNSHLGELVVDSFKKPREFDSVWADLTASMKRSVFRFQEKWNREIEHREFVCCETCVSSRRYFAGSRVRDNSTRRSADSPRNCNRQEMCQHFLGQFDLNIITSATEVVETSHCPAIFSHLKVVNARSALKSGLFSFGSLFHSVKTSKWQSLFNSSIFTVVEFLSKLSHEVCYYKRYVCKTIEIEQSPILTETLSRKSYRNPAICSTNEAKSCES